MRVCLKCHAKIADTLDIVAVRLEPARDVFVQPGGNAFTLHVDVVVGGAGAEGPLPWFNSLLVLSTDAHYSDDDAEVSEFIIAAQEQQCQIRRRIQQTPCQT